MRNVYKVLAYLVAAGVVVQAMAMVFAVAGMERWISAGGVLDKAVQESDETPFPEVSGFIVHGIVGSIGIPALALLLLLCSFLAKVPGSVRWAGLVFVLVVVQVNLGFAGPDIPALGAVHGLNAIALFTAALHTGRRARLASAAPAPQPELTGAV